MALTLAWSSFGPDPLENLQNGEIIEEATLTLDLDTSLADGRTVNWVHALGSDDKERPKEEFIDARGNAQRSDVEESP